MKGEIHSFASDSCMTLSLCSLFLDNNQKDRYLCLRPQKVTGEARRTSEETLLALEEQIGSQQ